MVSFRPSNLPRRSSPPRIDLQRLRRLQRWSEGSDGEKNLCAREELNPDCVVVWIKVSTGIKSGDLGGRSIRPPQSVHLPYGPHFITGATLRHVPNIARAAQYGNEQATEKLLETPSTSRQ